MEKKKSQLRKVKAQYIRGRKQGEARSLNCQFTQYTRQVYAKFEMMCKGEEERPRYQRSINNSPHGNGGDTFENIEEASSFWRRLWESSGTGNKDEGWLQELKEAIAERVPPPTEEAWQLEPSEAVKVLLKERN